MHFLNPTAKNIFIVIMKFQHFIIIIKEVQKYLYNKYITQIRNEHRIMANSSKL